MPARRATCTHTAPLPAMRTCSSQLFMCAPRVNAAPPPFSFFFSFLLRLCTRAPRAPADFTMGPWLMKKITPDSLAPDLRCLLATESDSVRLFETAKCPHIQGQPSQIIHHATRHTMRACIYSESYVRTRGRLACMIKGPRCATRPT